MDGISIVIATKGRVELLGNLLESLVPARKNYPGESEVILVDDSSEEDVRRIEELCGRYDARRVYFSPSVAGKRNYGARQAKYDLILFLDSDCVATEHLLELHAQKYDSERVGGAAGPLEFTGKENWFWRSVAASPFLICFKMPYWGPESQWAPTANFSVRKSAFESIGGFDESFPNKPGGEDVDLGLRMIKKGYHIVNVPEALVHHDKATWEKVRPMLRRCWYYGRADVYVVERHEDYSCCTLPRKLLLSALALLTILICAFFTSPVFLWAMPLYLLCDWVIATLISMKTDYGDNDFLHQFCTVGLKMTNEAGYLWECLARRDFAMMRKQTVFVDNQIKGVPFTGMVNALQFSLQTAAVITAALVCF